MSGIYIPGMEMPESCFQCEFRTKIDPDNLMCIISQKTFEERFFHIEHCDPSCPLVPAADVITWEELQKTWKIANHDVAPVRHGRWIKHGWSIVCSECGEDYAFAKRKFCPNCGARMEES